MIKFILSLDSSGAVKGIDELEKKGTSLSKKFSAVGKAMTIGITTPLTGLAAAGIKYNASMETYAANLTTLLNGNQKAASQLLSDLKAMANTTPFETTSLVKATQTMLGFGIQLQDSQKYLKQLGDIAMGDANKLDGLTLAFAQVQSAGKLSGQDLLQMINQGFNPLNVISQKTGESMADLKERMGDGALSAQEVAQALQWATEEGGLFYGAMDKASQTTEGKLSTLKDEFNSAVGEMTTSLLPTFTKTVDKLTEIARWFSNLKPNQKEFIVQMSKIAVVTGPALIILGKLIDTFDKTKKRIELVKKTMKALDLVTKSHTIATKAQTVATNLAAGAMKLFNLVMNANPLFLIVTAIVAVVAGLILMYNKFEWFRNAVNSVFSFVIKIVQSVIDFFKNVFILIVAIVAIALESIWNLIKPFVNLVISVFQSIWNAIVGGINFVKNIFLTFINFIYTNILIPIYNFFSSVWNNIWSVISSVITRIKSGFSTVASFVKTTFNNVKSFISNIFSTIAGVIKAPINGVISAINTVLRSMNKIKVPDWVPGLGGKHPNFSLIPKLSVGTNYVQHEGLAYLHQGEAVVPKKYNPAIGGYGNSNQVIYVTVNADMDVNKFGKAFVRDVKTFSGGSKNSYNYGGSQ